MGFHELEAGLTNDEVEQVMNLLDGAINGLWDDLANIIENRTDPSRKPAKPDLSGLDPSSREFVDVTDKYADELSEVIDSVVHDAMVIWLDT